MNLKALSARVDLGQETSCIVDVMVRRVGPGVFVTSYRSIIDGTESAWEPRLIDVVDVDGLEKAQISNLVVDLQAILVVDLQAILR